MIWAVGCGKSAQEKVAEKAIEQQTGDKADVDIGDESMEITTEDGEVSMKAGKGAKLPDSFPEDVHVYDGARVAMAMQMPGGMSVGLTTKDDIDAVKKSYETEMQKQGWNRTSAMEMGEQSVLMFTKEERVANIAISRDSEDEAGTRISITLAANE
jgi:hypothetical protein